MLSLNSYMHGLGSLQEPLSLALGAVYIAIVVVVCTTLIIEEKRRVRDLEVWRRAQVQYPIFRKGKW